MSNMEREFPVKESADKVYETVKDMHRELPYNVTAPTVYSLLGNLKSAGGYFMRDFLTDTVERLSRSLVDFDYYTNEGPAPADAVAKANKHIIAAAAYADLAGKELELAQSALAWVGYREPGDIGYRKPEDRT